MPRKETKTTPRVHDGILQDRLDVFPVGDRSRWQDWLASHLTFYAELPEGTFTARRELRRGSWFWYAYRRAGGRLHKSYLGRSEELSEERMRVVARSLSAKLAA